jgi:phosphoribosylformylglycinamidine synthase
VSLYNETDGTAIAPTPTIGMVGLMPDARLATSSHFKNDADLIVLVGETREEIGGSEYLAVIHGREEGTPPALDLDLEAAVQELVLRAIDLGIVRSAHDVSDGGLAVALAECCIGGTDALGSGLPLRGASVDLHEAIRADILLFGESASRVLLTLAEKDLPALEASHKGLAGPSAKVRPALRVIGRVGGGHLEIRGGGAMLLKRPVDALHKMWHSGFPALMRA